MSRRKNNSRKRARQKRLRAALLHLPFTSHLLMLGWWNWQTRTFEGRMPKGLRVRVPPRARFQRWIGFSEGDANLIAEGVGISGQRHSKFTNALGTTRSIFQ